jgi:hypothetical protein
MRSFCEKCRQADRVNLSTGHCEWLGCDWEAPPLVLEEWRQKEAEEQRFFAGQYILCFSCEQHSMSLATGVCENPFCKEKDDLSITEHRENARRGDSFFVKRFKPGPLSGDFVNWVVCPKCQGSRHFENESYLCRLCNFSGYATISRANQFRDGVKCPRCEERGQVVDDSDGDLIRWEECPECHGVGRTTEAAAKR